MEVLYYLKLGLYFFINLTSSFSLQKVNFILIYNLHTYITESTERYLKMNLHINRFYLFPFEIVADSSLCCSFSLCHLVFIAHWGYFRLINPLMTAHEISRAGLYVECVLYRNETHLQWVNIGREVRLSSFMAFKLEFTNKRKPKYLCFF